MMSLSCSNLTVSVAQRVLVRALTLEATSGSMTAILGCNGTGKTLTLHTLAGIREAAQGEVQLDRKNIREWPRRELARTLGLLTQVTDDPFPSTVMETVLIG